MVTMIIDSCYENFLKQLKDYGLKYKELHLRGMAVNRDGIKVVYYYDSYLSAKYFYAFYDEDKKELIELPNITCLGNEEDNFKEICFFPSVNSYTNNDTSYSDLIKNIEFIRENYELKNINTVSDNVALLLRHTYNLEEKNDRGDVFKRRKVGYEFSFLRKEIEIRNALEQILGKDKMKELFSIEMIKAYTDDILELIEDKGFQFYYHVDRYEFFYSILKNLFYFEGEDYITDELFCNLIDRLENAIKLYKESKQGFYLYMQRPIIQKCYSKEKIKKYYNLLFNVAILANNKSNNHAALENLRNVHNYLNYTEIKSLPSFEKFKINITKYITRNKNAKVLESVYESIPELIDWSKEDKNLLKEAFPKGMKVGDFEFNPEQRTITVENYPSVILSTQYPTKNNLIMALSFIIYGNCAEYLDEMSALMFNLLNQQTYSRDAKNSFKDALYAITAYGKYEVNSENFKIFVNKIFEKVDEINSVTDYRKYLDFAQSCKIITLISPNDRSDKFKSLLMEYKLKK